MQLLQEIEEDRPETPTSDAGEMDDALYDKLKRALMEAESLKHEAYEETRRRQMAERELAEASRMVVVTKLHHFLPVKIHADDHIVCSWRPCLFMCVRI